ncbi:hypothetical protein CEXT_197871 [Caerostris extrusa]|uniref:Serine/threonine-protein kinase 19 n=1 Tax=Caerostris extrusa TaxID=172846 RepID=A0AAV4PQS2_CAEEX|nr:hypothetical protein CEXT_197871 [Caerostris extrusa]
MIRKRSLMSDICENKRRKLICGDSESSIDALPSDTKSALSYIASSFPTEKFTNKFPPIVLRHQIYAFVKCRTDVDKELNELKNKGELILFRIGERNNQLAIIYTNDYTEYIDRSCRKSPVIENFLKKVLAVCPNIKYSNTVLRTDYGFCEEDIAELIQQGVLILGQDVGWYWLSIPRVGEFMKTFLYGRRAILQHVRRTKYKEILLNELQQRKLPKKALLGVSYHIYDIIGSDAVNKIDTSSGVMLRLLTEHIRI